MTSTRHILIEVDTARLLEKVKQLLNEDGHKSVTIMVRGYSMRPFLENCRDKVILAAPKPPQKGQVVLAETAPGVYVMHRIIDISGDIITMRGDGNGLSQTEQFKSSCIIGTAIAFVRKGKHVSTDSRLWRTYSFIWELLRPVRRILLAVYRRTH